MLNEINVPIEDKKEYEIMINIGIDIVNKDLKMFRLGGGFSC